MAISIKATRAIVTNEISLNGPTVVTQNTSVSYLITDYNSFSTYSVSTTIGTVTRTNDTINLVVPATSSNQISLTVIKDNKASLFVIAVGATTIVTPSITSPSEGQTNVNLTPTLTSTNFATAPAGADTQSGSRWQIATNTSFANIVWDSGVVTNKNSISVPSGVLTSNNTYFARVSHIGTSLGTSPFSLTRTFSVSSQYVATPTLSIVGGATSVGDGPTFNTSAFSVVGGTDTHASTSWKVLDSSNNVVWQSLGDSNNLTQITMPTGLLTTSGSYLVQASHAGAKYGQSGVASLSFTTAITFLTPGAVYGGGFYVGRIKANGDTYALIVAPKASGETSLPIKTADTSTPGSASRWDGLSNTNAMLNATGSADCPAAKFCQGLTIGGFSDWSIPAQDQLELMYRVYKPTNDQNINGEAGNLNPSSDPVGGYYSAFVPAQTSITAFKSGGVEAFRTDIAYWTSTETQNTFFNWIRDFTNGGTSGNSKSRSYLVRAVRMVKI